jgi:mannobiose 2-epimerase
MKQKMDELKQLCAEAKEELLHHIIPFWESMQDFEHGGFYGYMGQDLVVDKTYDKGCILNSRILWFFSEAYLALGDEKLLAVRTAPGPCWKSPSWITRKAACSGLSLTTVSRRI